MDFYERLKFSKSELNRKHALLLGNPAMWGMALVDCCIAWRSRPNAMGVKCVKRIFDFYIVVYYILFIIYIYFAFGYIILKIAG